MPAIELKKLTKFFGAVPAVLEASLTVEEGDFFGFVGPNGSGKSTTIRMMMNYVLSYLRHRYHFRNGFSFPKRKAQKDGRLCSQ